MDLTDHCGPEREGALADTHLSGLIMPSPETGTVGGGAAYLGDHMSKWNRSSPNY